MPPTDDDLDIPALEVEDEAPEEEDAEVETEGDEGEGGDEPQSQGRANPQNGDEAGRVRQPTGRADARLRALRDQAAAEKARADALADTLTRFQRPAAPAFDPQAAALAAQREQEQLAMMQPHEAMQYLLKKNAETQQQQLQTIQRQMQDSLDRTEFKALAATNKTVARYADKVEEIVQRGAASGIVIPRQVALKHHLGELVLAKLTTAPARQRSAAASRVAQQTTRPGGPGGDARSEVRGARGGDDLAAIEARLRDVIL